MLAGDAAPGDSDVTCLWPELFDETSGWFDAPEGAVLSDVLCISGPPAGATYTCTNKPPVLIFDVNRRPETLGSSTDIARIDRIVFDPLNHRVKFYLVEEVAGVWQEYELQFGYDAGKGDGDAAAAIGRVRQAGDAYGLDVAYWSDLAPDAINVLESRMRASFVDLQILEDPYQVYPHFWMREKLGISQSPPPYFREKWFNSVEDSDYWNVVNVVFDRLVSVGGAYGFTHSHRNASFIFLDEFAFYNPLDGTLDTEGMDDGDRTAFRHTLVHEVTHHYRVAAEVTLPGGEHCDQATLNYDPPQGMDPNGCYMQAGSVLDARVSSNLNLCEFCLLGDRPNASYPDLGIRRRDGLYVDTVTWNGAP